MSELRVLCTNPDNTVAIIVPAPQAINVLREGGSILCCYSRWRFGFHRYLLQHWPERWVKWLGRGRVPLAIARAWEIHKFVSDPHWRPDRMPEERRGLAAYWVDALIAGGLDERQAVWLIGQKDAPAFSTALEIVDKSEIPTDRRHRNAWRRSSNGGPIWIDDDVAQSVDEARMWSAYERTSLG